MQDVFFTERAAFINFIDNSWSYSKRQEENCLEIEFFINDVAIMNLPVIYDLSWRDKSNKNKTGIK